MSHTPGPWNCSGDGAEVWPMEGDKAQVELARIAGPWDSSSWFGKDEALANARLISAAPDLLEACELLLIYLGDWNDMEDETCAAARRAIAKARGQEVPNG